MMQLGEYDITPGQRPPLDTYDRLAATLGLIERGEPAPAALHAVLRTVVWVSYLYNGWWLLGLAMEWWR